MQEAEQEEEARAEEKPSSNRKYSVDISDNLRYNKNKTDSEQFHDQFDSGTQEMFAEKGYTQEDISKTYDEVMSAMESVADDVANAQSHAELDEIRDNLKPIRVRLMDFSKAKTPDLKAQAAIDVRVAREVFENAVRGSEARSRIEKKAPPSHQRSRSARDKQSAKNGLHGGGSERISEFAYSVNGYLLDTPSNKRDANDYYVHIRNEYKPKKHSNQGAFSNAKHFSIDGKPIVGVRKYSAAWHGSPHKFDTFSLEAIGTGESAQMRGYGLYFAKKIRL